VAETIAMKRLACKHCTNSTGMNETSARANGWRIWRGTTQGGSYGEDVICPRCAGTTNEPPPSWRVGCHTCDWEHEDEYDEGPLDEKAAKRVADDHECEPSPWVKPPVESS
jgi:hypothetical protein